MGFKNPLKHRQLADVRGSEGGHAFGLVQEQSILTTAAPGVGTLLLVNGRMYATPFYVPARRSFVGANARVTTAGTAGALARFGVYSTSAVNPLPGSLVFDAGTLATDALGLLSFSIPGAPIIMQEGIYWFVIVGQGSPATQATLQAVTGRNPFTSFGLGDPAFTDLVGVRSIAATHLGALPDPIGTMLADTTPMPRVTMQ